MLCQDVLRMRPFFIIFIGKPLITIVWLSGRLVGSPIFSSNSLKDYKAEFWNFSEIESLASSDLLEIFCLVSHPFYILTYQHTELNFAELNVPLSI